LYGFGIAFDIEDRLLELGADSVDGFEGVVLEDFLADFIPEVFLGVETLANRAAGTAARYCREA
jgi:hypothetical protein